MRAPNRTTRLGLEALDNRIVPAVTRIDLTNQGAQAAVAGGLVEQTNAQPAANFSSFVRLNGGSVEQGYNTDARPLQFDAVGNKSVTHSLKLGDIPTVVVNGTTYREFVLDIRERVPALSLDEAQVFIGDFGNLKNYNARAQTLAGNQAVFDLDAGGDVSVMLNNKTSTGTGFGDMTLLVPEIDFAGSTNNTFVYLYTKFGGIPGARADGGAETWAVRIPTTPPVTPPPPPASTGSLSGHLLVDNGGGALSGISGATITLTDSTGTVVGTATTDSSGAYSFANLAAGTYTIAVTNIPLAFSYLPAPDNVGTINGQQVGTSSGDDQFTVSLGDGQTGTNYDFIELLGG